MALVEIAGKIESPTVSPQLGAEQFASLHRALLEATAAESADGNRRVHIHCSRPQPTPLARFAAERHQGVC